ncbi:MAG: oxidoreductase [Hyphomonadaceae bacterium]|nr:oxidoreductase [Hyphomonadaceae bacterium]
MEARMRQAEDTHPESRCAHAAGPSRRGFLYGSAAAIAVGAVAGCAARDPSVPDWTAEDMPSMTGRRVIVTGANGYPQGDRSGLGYHQALALARAGADVTIASRNQTRGAEAVRRISAAAPGAAVRFEPLDLANLASVEAFATRMAAGGDRLDLLVNNAGVMARAQREVSVDGFERVFATNVLGPFALTARLFPLLRKGAGARVVWMASMRGHTGRIAFDDLQQEARYDHARAYNDSKLANLLLAFALERRSQASGWGVTSLAAHPGVARTNIVLDGPGPDSAEGWRFRNIPLMWQDPAQGALPILYAATAPQAVGGGYYGPRDFMGMRGLPGVTQPPAAARDAEVAATLWATLERLGGVTLA